MSKDWALITGFGPFGKIKENISWSAVQNLPDDIKIDDGNLQLIKIEFPVEYEFVDSFYEKLLFKDLSTLTIEDGEWQEFSIVTSRSKKIIRIPLYAPKIIIHVGVSGQARCMLLESRAFNSADVLDIAGRVPINNKIIQSLDKDFCEKCSLDLTSMKMYLNDSKFSFVDISFNAGRFLCNYSYFKALRFVRNSTIKALFIHVPETNLSVVQLTNLIEKSVKYCCRKYNSWWSIKKIMIYVAVGVLGVVLWKYKYLYLYRKL